MALVVMSVDPRQSPPSPDSRQWPDSAPLGLGVPVGRLDSTGPGLALAVLSVVKQRLDAVRGAQGPRSLRCNLWSRPEREDTTR